MVQTHGGGLSCERAQKRQRGTTRRRHIRLDTAGARNCADCLSLLSACALTLGKCLVVAVSKVVVVRSGGVLLRNQKNAPRGACRNAVLTAASQKKRHATKQKNWGRGWRQEGCRSVRWLRSREREGGGGGCRSRRRAGQA